MGEPRPKQHGNPLRAERGDTVIQDTVVSKLAGIAAEEVGGVHKGGGASRVIGGVLEGVTSAPARRGWPVPAAQRPVGWGATRVSQGRSHRRRQSRGVVC